MGQHPKNSVYQCLIVDDDPAFSDQLSRYINNVNFLKLTKVSTTGMDGLQVLTTQPIDVLFLDLNLPDMPGLDLLKALPTPPLVIAVSAQTEHAMECFDFDIVDFLHKPFTYDRFLRSLSRALKRMPSVSEAINTGTINSSIAESAGGHTVDIKAAVSAKDDIFIKSGRQLERIAMNDILYVEASGAKSTLHTSNGTVHLNRRIATLQCELPGSRFVRIHKSFIVNIAFINQVEQRNIRFKDTELQYGLPVGLPIGVTYRTIVQEQLAKVGVF
jgi:DNA-binding LytR/AlgR family response regulator